MRVSKHTFIIIILYNNIIRGKSREDGSRKRRNANKIGYCQKNESSNDAAE